MRSQSESSAQGNAQAFSLLRIRPCTQAVFAALAIAALTTMPALAAEQDAPASASTAPTALKAVVVTGSLISSPNQVSASPISTVDMSDLKLSSSSVSVANVLNQLPQFSATSGTLFTRSGVQTINLRGLGSNRNLVLLDGRRLPPADNNGNVGTNLIPEAAIERADIITGGASAVYGSDAVSGVVNFLTVPYFDGIRGDVQYGNTTKNDLFQQAASVALGSSFGSDNNGHVLLALGYTNSQGMQGSKRDFFKNAVPSSYIGQGTFVPSGINLPDQGTVNALFQSYGAATPVANTLNLGFNDDGSLFTQTGAKNYKGPTTGGFAILGGNVRMPVGPQTALANPVKTKQTFTKFDYAFSPHFDMYGQFMYVKSESKWNSGLSLVQIFVPSVPATNPFIPADLHTLLASRPNPNASFTWNARFVEVPTRIIADDYATTQFLLGAKGDIAGDWTYDAYVSHSSMDHTSQIFNAVLGSRLQTLLNAPDGGASICAGGFNPFGLANSLSTSPACLSYLTTTANSQEKLNQNIAQATVQGSLFDLPAGPLKLAVLGDVRRDNYTYEPDTSLAAGDIEATGASLPSSGATQVKELATQVEIPILSDLPFAQSLTADAAYRYSKYRLAGGVNTYEADLKWRPVDSLLVRGGYQRAVRAPNINEYFGAANRATVSIGTPPIATGDPCDIRSSARSGPNAASVRQLCIEQGMPAAVTDTYMFPTTAVGGLTSGNTSLKPERANTWNAGFQWTSTSSSDLFSTMMASVDYWNIDIKQVISAVPGTTSLSKCFNLDGTNPTYSPDNQFCKLIQRDQNGLMTTLVTPFLNLGSLKTDGVDLQFNWAPSLRSLGMNAPGALFLNSQVSYTRSYKIQTLPNGPEQEFVNTISQAAVGSTALAKWKSMTSIGFNNQNFTVGLRWNYLSAMNDISSVTNPANPAPGTSSYSTFDLFGTYFLNDELQLRAGLNNLTNKGPLPVATSEIGTNPYVYNLLGRTYYVGLHFSL